MCEYIYIFLKTRLNAVLKEKYGALSKCVGGKWFCTSQVTLNWSSERANPGEKVSLTVAGSESRFQVGVTVMAMQNDPLQFDLDQKVEQVGVHWIRKRKSL